MQQNSAGSNKKTIYLPIAKGLGNTFSIEKIFCNKKYLSPSDERVIPVILTTMSNVQVSYIFNLIFI